MPHRFKNRRHPSTPRLVWAARLVLMAMVMVLATSDALALGVKHFCCMVPMRDGVRLATDVYLPRLPRGPHPVILVRTPYGRDQIKKLYARLVCIHGCGLAVQDVRGRHGSEGVDIMFQPGETVNPTTDGHDTIEWLARQSWCNGRVGTWGPSALGIVQNLQSPDAPAALRAQHVMMACSNMYAQAAYQGGVYRKSLIEEWFTKFDLNPAGIDAIRQHPTYDDFWRRLNAETRAAEVNAPAVYVGGWYDIFQQGTINSFVSVNEQGGPRAQGRCRLILGPWSHDDLAELIDPRNADRVPAAADAFRFFAYWLMGECNGAPCDQPVHYYVMGDRCDPRAPGNCWRSAASWPPPATQTAYYLHADERLSPAPPDAADAERSYQYDPEKPVPTLGGQNFKQPQGAKDQRCVESRDDVLVFSTDVLSEPVEVTGRILARLYVSSDCPDTDFTVKLTDVYPDGRSMLLTDGILRARYRESFERGELLEPGKVYELEVDLWSTSIVFNRGHRIRVAVSSSNAPRFEPNPNTGEPWSENAATRVATNTIHLSPEHASHVLLPIAGRQPQDASAAH